MNFQSFNSYRTDVETALRGVPVQFFNEAVEILRECQKRDSMVFVLGNGGSAATASHFSNDLLKMCKLRAVSIPDMTPMVTAYGNDLEWENMFSLPLSVLLRPSDVVIGISCSGKSRNVIFAMETAQALKAKTIVLTGDNRQTPLTALGLDLVINVPFRDIRVQEDCHMVICHAIAGALSRGK